MPVALPLLLAAAAAPPTPAEPAPVPDAAGVLTVMVENVRAARGHVRLDVCPQARFLKDNCPYSGSAPAVKGTTAVVVHGLPPGRYAVQAYLDEDDNGRVTRGLLGIPKEGFGFSNDARAAFSAPGFADAAFSFGGGTAAIRLKLRYIL